MAISRCVSAMQKSHTFPSEAPEGCEHWIRERPQALNWRPSTPNSVSKQIFVRVNMLGVFAITFFDKTQDTEAHRLACHYLTRIPRILYILYCTGIASFLVNYAVSGQKYTSSISIEKIIAVTHCRRSLQQICSHVFTRVTQVWSWYKFIQVVSVKISHFNALDSFKYGPWLFNGLFPMVYAWPNLGEVTWNNPSNPMHQSSATGPNWIQLEGDQMGRDQKLEH